MKEQPAIALFATYEKIYDNLAQCSGSINLRLFLTEEK
jgi:hypothetical protein